MAQNTMSCHTCSKYPGAARRFVELSLAVRSVRKVAEGRVGPSPIIRMVGGSRLETQMVALAKIGGRRVCTGGEQTQKMI